MCRSHNSPSPPPKLPGFDASDQTLKDGKPCTNTKILTKKW